MGQRRKGREGALQILYQLEALLPPGQGPSLKGVDAARVDEALARFFENFAAPDKSHDYTRALVQGVVARSDELDALIEAHSPRWKIARLAMVDRNVLRIAALELLTAADVPVKVIIDEAIEIARRYGSEKSGAFVNGVLDPLAKVVRAAVAS